MNLPDIKALEKLLKLLRNQGVLQYQSADLNLVLAEKPPTPERTKSLAEETAAEDEGLSEEEYNRLLFYSAQPPLVDPKDQA